MKAKILLIALIWLVPVGCWFGAAHADRLFAFGAGSVFACLTTVYLACQSMLRCGVCGASTRYFDNYTQTTARLRGNWRRYFVCGSCGNIIDRMTGMLVTGVPDTPVVSAPSRSDIGWGVSGFGALLIFGAVVIGAVALLEISSGKGQSGRAETALMWCLVTATVGVGSVFAGRFFTR